MHPHINIEYSFHYIEGHVTANWYIVFYDYPVKWDIDWRLTSQVRQTQWLQLACLISQKNSNPNMAKLTNQQNTSSRDDVNAHSQTSQLQA